ncbi:MAG TPA: N-formylglutamate amidohydrolase [Xanthomonadaceae bacterium]|nr:N-formylglutamate amidohydrolase [Xanthomonadaceae bacterium]
MTETRGDADFEYLPGRDRSLLLLCDHASAAVPGVLGDLGLQAQDRLRHIAWDPGAAAVTRLLAAQLDCPAFLHGWSRLVCDPNRDVDDPDLILAESDGTHVPGNEGVDPTERRHRWQRYHQPYHRAITAHLDTVAAAGVAPLLFAVHTFTPVYGGQLRPWRAGVLWRVCEAPSRRFLTLLRARGIEVEENLPYSGEDRLGYTLEHHGTARGLEHLLIEIRHDLVEAPDQQQRWAAVLADALTAFRAETAPA